MATDPRIGLELPAVPHTSRQYTRGCTCTGCDATRASARRRYAARRGDKLKADASAVRRRIGHLLACGYTLKEIAFAARLCEDAVQRLAPPLRPHATRRPRATCTSATAKLIFAVHLPVAPDVLDAEAAAYLKPEPAKRGPQRTSPHGTDARYRAHLRDGEPACAECKAATARKKRERIAAKKTTSTRLKGAA